jgi:hypothetical protein
MDSRHMNQAVDLAECVHGAFGCRDAFCLIGHVCARFNKARSMILLHLIDWKWLQVHSANAVAIHEQAFNASQADATRGSGNNDMFERDR